MSSNLATVLGCLTNGPASRAELARNTGLTKATVSSLVGELVALGLVRDTPDSVRGPTGRPATLVSVSGDHTAAIGLEVNVDYLAAGAVDLEGRLTHDRLVPADCGRASPTSTIGRLASMGAAVSRALSTEQRRLVGVVVAVPGLVSQPDGRVLTAPNLGWSEVALHDQLTDLMARRGVEIDADRIWVDNEANLAALAHVRAMRQQSIRSFLVVSGGVGVGAGVVSDGKLFRGSHGFGGELGHFVVEPGGRRCRCGNHGCLETIAGETSLRRLAGPRRRVDTPWLDAVAHRARSGDGRVLSGLGRVGQALAVALSAAVNLLDPEAIVLGGCFAALAPWLEPTLRDSLGKQVMGYRWAPTAVLASEIGRSAAVVGAGQLALAELVADPAAMSTGLRVHRSSTG